MVIKMTKHWHFLVALLALFVLNGLTPSVFIIRVIFGFLILILLIMWISFAFSKKAS